MVLPARRKLEAAQDRYKRDHDKKVHIEPRYVPGDFVFFNRHQLKTSVAGLLGSGNYTRLACRWHGPYRVVRVGTKAFKIRQGVVNNVVSLNSRSKAPSRPEKNINCGEKKITMVASERQQTERNSERRRDTRRYEEYVVERIVRPVQAGDETHYEVRWFRYIEGDKMVEPLKHIPHHFVDTYRKHGYRKDKRKTKSADATNHPVSRQVQRFTQICQQ